MLDIVELVIRIPDEEYKKISNSNPSYADDFSVYYAIKNGVPLPEGHGDIVDIETLIDMFWDGNSMEITKYDLPVIEPIIEADKAKSEDKE